MKEKLPWYIRLNEYINNSKMSGAKIAFLLISSIMIISIMVYIFWPVASYEEINDVQFNKYITEELENIADKVIQEDSSINLEKIPAIVKEYNIKYNEKGIQFNYILDNEKIILEYYSKTGKNMKNLYNDRNLEMNIEMSKDLKKKSMTSSMDDIISRKQYEKEKKIEKLSASTNVWIISAITIMILLACIGFAGIVIGTISWKAKNS